MSDYFAEPNYEQALIELFKGLGYRYVYGPDVKRDFTVPIYEEEFDAALERLNPEEPRDSLADARRKLTEFENADLVRKNEIFTDYLQNGVPTRYFVGGEERFGRVRLVDYTNPDANSFVVANQWTFVEKSQRRADLLLFLNGLPVVFIELKSPSREETDASEAYTQIRNYLHEIPSIFVYNCICVISDLAISKAGTITSDEDRFMEWKSKDGVYEDKQAIQYDTFFEGLFERSRLLDVIRNFICFSDDGRRSIKILAGYHQYFSVNKALASTERATETDGRGGVFWHTQGSGKSLSMVFYVHRLQETLESPTVVVITDRNDLDDQLFNQFIKCRKFLRQTPIQAQSRQDLKKLLEGRKANGIFFTTLQKFEEGDEPLSTRRNVVVIADEAHRSHYGLSETIDHKTGRIRTGAARVLRENLPNAVYIGFTGTPIALKNKNTQEVFGDLIDVYDMSQAVADGATRPVYYESRAIKLNLDEETLRKIDAEYDQLAENADPEVIEQSKRKLGQLDAILGHEKTINSLVDDILDHYENHRANLLTGKAMIVAYSREVAMKIYGRIRTLRPEWTESGKEKIAVVMTESAKDPEEWRPIIGNKTKRQELAGRFKDDADTLKIAIVVDMWLTGFDVPSLATMYFFKPMQGHNLMQAIARVNRVFGDKEGGLIVDYIGIARALKEAMSEYTTRDREQFGDPDIAKKAKPEFDEKLTVCRELFHGCDYSPFKNGSDADRMGAIKDAANFILAPEKSESLERFKKESLLLRNALSLCSSIVDESDRLEAAFFEAVRVLVARMTNQGGGKKFSLREINAKINELLKQSVKSDGVLNLFSDESESISLFDPKFLEEISKLKRKNLVAELLRKLIEEQVRIYRRTNVVKSEKFSEIFKRAMNRYRNGLLTNAEVIEELLNLAKMIADARKDGEKLGLTEDELAFYDALSKPQAVRDFYENDQLVALTRELTDALRRNRKIDWQTRESARAEMRVMVKKLLKKYGYPPKETAGAVETVIEQCELWADQADMANDATV